MGMDEPLSSPFHTEQAAEILRQTAAKNLAFQLIHWLESDCAKCPTEKNFLLDESKTFCGSGISSNACQHWRHFSGFFDGNWILFLSWSLCLGSLPASGESPQYQVERPNLKNLDHAECRFDDAASCEASFSPSGPLATGHRENHPSKECHGFCRVWFPANTRHGEIRPSCRSA